jgi:hypothetical protein
MKRKVATTQNLSCLLSLEPKRTFADPGDLFKIRRDMDGTGGYEL